MMKRFNATIIRGHQVASGNNGNPNYPGGTIRMQIPFFQKLGLDLTPYFPGTINASIAPCKYKVVKAPWTFPLIKWHPVDPAETFSFITVRRIFENGNAVKGLIYYPYPETKPKHFQPNDVLELLFPKMDDIKYGNGIVLEIDENEIVIS